MAQYTTAIATQCPPWRGDRLCSHDHHIAQWVYRRSRGQYEAPFIVFVRGHLFIAGEELSETDREIAIIADGTVLEDIVGDVGLRVQSVQRRSEASATIIFGSRQAPESIDGVDFSVETGLLKGVPLLSGNVGDLADTENPIILTGLTAENLGVEVGERVVARLMTVTGQVNVGEFTVIGISDDSTSFGFTSAYADLQYLNSLIGLEPTQYQKLTIALTDVRDIERSAQMIYDAAVARGLNIERPLIDQNGGESGQTVMVGSSANEVWEGTKFGLTTLDEILDLVTNAFELVDLSALVIFVVLLLITMVGITNTFRMVLVERIQEVGTMRAFGMQRRTVRSIFLWEAAFIAMGGGVVGIGLAGVIMVIVSKISLAQFTAMHLFTMNGFLTFDVTVGSLVTNVAIVLAMSLLAAFLPANAGAKMEPAKALGGHF